MPQLNPSPWLVIFLFTWIIFLALIPIKVVSYTFPNELSHASTKVYKTQNWLWPWQ